MNRLPLTLALVLAMALAAASAQETTSPHGRADGAYGCCCPWSAHLGTCPVSPGMVLDSFDDVCVRDFDEDGQAVYCEPGEEGEHPYRGMTLEEIALFSGFEDVGGLLDFLCGYDWDKW